LQDFNPRKVRKSYKIIRGTQKEGLPPQPDDEDEQHVLIIGDTEDTVTKAQYLVEKVLYSDEATRNKIREEQLKASQEIRSELFYGNILN
jgi:hypothetical protein